MDNEVYQNALDNLVDEYEKSIKEFNSGVRTKSEYPWAVDCYYKTVKNYPTTKEFIAFIESNISYLASKGISLDSQVNPTIVSLYKKDAPLIISKHRNTWSVCKS